MSSWKRYFSWSECVAVLRLALFPHCKVKGGYHNQLVSLGDNQTGWYALVVIDMSLGKELSAWDSGHELMSSVLALQIELLRPWGGFSVFMCLSFLLYEMAVWGRRCGVNALWGPFQIWNSLVIQHGIFIPLPTFCSKVWDNHIKVIKFSMNYQ